MRPGNLLVAFAAGCTLLACAAGAQETPAAAGDGYTYSPSEHFGTGKAFMGRPIAQVVDINGAEWFDRSDREAEEGTDKLLPLLRIKPTDVIADIGAGTGYFTFRMARLAPQGTVYAQDIQQGMLDIVARHRANDPAPNVVTVLGTAIDPKLPAGRIDLILLVDVYHEMLYPREMGAAMMRALKPRGRIALVEYRGEDPAASAQNLHKMTESQARKEFAAMGYDWVSTDSTTMPLHRLMIFAKPAS